MARKQHTHHYIYKTTCNVTGRYYIGMHSTSNLEDGYIGSGRRLWLSINKHGKESHSIEILEWLPDRSSLKLREKEIVNEDLLKDEMCMNLQIGGGGGFSSTDHQLKMASAGGKSLAKKRKNDLEFDREFKLKMSMSTSEAIANGKIPKWSSTFSWVGKKHSVDTILKMKESKSNYGKGDKNSQFGTIWITNGIENKKIKKDSDIPVDWKKGRS